MGGMPVMAKESQTEQEKWPVLSTKERDRRWKRVRELMRTQGVECLVVFGLKDSNQYDGYLTNDRTGGVTIFPLKGQLVQLYWHPQYMVGHLESTLRGEESWVQDVRLGTSGAGVVEVLKEMGFEQADIGVVGVSIFGVGQVEGFVPFGTWSNITKNLPKAKFHEMSQEFAQLMSIKSDEEIQLVRRSADIGELASGVLMKVARPGKTENEIYSEIMHEIFLNGANGSRVPYATPLILHSGKDNPSWGSPIWLVRAQKPRMVQRGDLVQAEIFTIYGGMEGQVQMSVALQPVDQMNKECAEIARQSYLAGARTLRPGNTFGQVVEAMEEPIKQAGAWHLTPLVHSLNPLVVCSRMGVGIEKLPGIKKYKFEGSIKDSSPETVIQANTVWELEPNACLGKYRVNIGGTVLATQRGCESLNKLATEMRVID